MKPNEFVDTLALETIDRIERQLKYDALQGFGQLVFEASDVDRLHGIIKSVIAAAHAEGTREERKRTTSETWKIIEWHQNPQHQMFGLEHANTTINALTQLLGKIQEQHAQSNTSKK